MWVKVSARSRARAPGVSRPSACGARCGPLIVAAVKNLVWRWTCAALAATTLGCPPADPGNETTSSSTGAGSTTTGDVTTGGVATTNASVQTVTSLPQTSGSSGGGSSGDTSGGDPCAAAVSGLAAYIDAGQPCEVLLHFDDAKAIQGFAVTCGASGTVWMSAKEVGGATQCCDGAAVYAPDQDNGPVYALFLENGAADGVALLSNHTGRVLLDAVTADGGPGPISVPAAWADAAELAGGQGCGAPVSLADALSYDIGAGGAPVGAGELAALADALGDTALGPALSGTSTPVRSVVLRYAPQNGGPSHDFVLLEVTAN